MTQNRINLCLSRQNFCIVSDEDPEYLKRLEASVNNRISTLQRLYPTMSTNKCALLALLNVEDELQKAKKSYETLEDKVLKFGGEAAAQAFSEQKQN